MTYEQALEYLASLNKFGMNFGLVRIEKLLALMNNPERQFKTIHVTGTNGKGSTTAMLAAILQAGGIKTGMYTSPHLVDYTERMMVNGRPASKQAFADAIDYTSRFVTEMVAAGWEHPTEFEVLTAAAFYYFAAAKVEYAVIEVGLGGLLDSTNVIVPEVAVITNVTLEHTDRCGNTVAEIAHHKAGIIKQGKPVVTTARGSALDVIQATAAEKESPLYVCGRDFYCRTVKIEDFRQTVAITTACHGDFNISINMLGRHQAENCGLAFAAAVVLAAKEPRLAVDKIINGLETAKWPGRFEVLAGKPTIVIDGAHNPDGARKLRETIDEVFPGQDIIFVIGVLADKDVTGITGNLLRMQDTAIVVRPISDRAEEPEALAAKIKIDRVEVAGTIADGIKRALQIAGPCGVVCVAGSLYLVGSARQLICEWTNQNG
jgi:dihydrofolate synthase/folylpolyglutamate synthase